MKQIATTIFGLGVAVVVAGGALADGMVAKVVSSPLSATGTVRDARVGINVYLQRPEAPGIEFMNPHVVGYGIPKGGQLELELVDGFARDPARRIDTVDLKVAAAILVTGTPQQGLPGGKAGYEIVEGDNPNTFVFRPTKPSGLPAESLMAGAPGAKKDPVRQRGIKVIHVGLNSAFFNRGAAGTVAVRLRGADGAVVSEGSATIDFLAAPVAQIHPTNLADGRRNHNWQEIAFGETLGHATGSVPIILMLYERAESAKGSKRGIVGAGVLSTQQLKAMKFVVPPGLARYTGGLIVQDSDGNGRIDPAADRIIGGVIGAAPAGAKGQEARSLVRDGVATLSRPTGAFSAGAGKRFGGAIMQVEFTAGDKPGVYRPTFVLLADTGDPAAGDGSSYTYTIVVR